MKTIQLIGLASLAVLLFRCSGTDTGLVQSELQKIYSSISDGNFQTANEWLVPANAITESPLAEHGGQIALFGQVRVIKTEQMGDGAEFVVYQVEIHEKNRRIYNRLDSPEYKELEKKGKIRSVNMETGVVVYAERRTAFRLLDEGDKTRYIIDPSPEALQAYLGNKTKQAQQLMTKYGGQ